MALSLSIHHLQTRSQLQWKWTRNWLFFTQISGRNFLPELCGEIHPGTAPLQALHCALCSTEQSTFRGRKKWRKCVEKRAGRGVASKRGKKEKRTRENRSGKFLPCALENQALKWFFAQPNLVDKDFPMFGFRPVFHSLPGGRTC